MPLHFSALTSARSRIYLISFFAIAILIHLGALRPGQGGSADLVGLLLILAAAAAAAMAVTLRQREARAVARPARPAPSARRRSHLVGEVESEFGRTRHGQGPMGVMVVEAASIAASADNDASRVLRMADEFLRRYLESDFRTFSTEKHLALVVWGSDPVGTLERLADRLQRDIRALRSHDSELRSYQLTCGIAVSRGPGSRPAELVMRATVALSQAKALGTAHYSITNR